MTSTQQEQESRPGVYAAALVALASHIGEHKLPFLDITKGYDGTPLSVFVYGPDHTTWLNTVQIVSESNTGPTDTNPDRIRTLWLVRLPDTNTLIELRTWRLVPFVHGPAALELVTA